MASMYRVIFNDGTSLIVHSADARTMKRRDLTAALTKARKKGEVRRQRVNPQAKAVRVNCVG